MSFIYPLPTTGTISFSDFLLDENNSYINEISEATAQRGRVRAVLKEVNKTDGPKDYMNVMKVIDDYLPYLLAIVDCLEGGQLRLKKEFVAIRKALMQQTSPSLLAKLAIGVAGHYEMANGLIKSLKESTKVSVGFITEAREVLHLLTKCKSPTVAAHAAQEYSEVNELYNIYVGINDT
ncbi:14618_t:CDS:2, partial [Racocetra fulgida]